MSRRVLFCALLLTGATAAAEEGAAAPRTVSLTEALTLAGRQNADVAAARAQAEAVRAAALKAWGAWLPELTASGQYVRTSAPSVLDIGPIIGLVGVAYQLGTPVIPPPDPVTIVAEESFYGTLQLSQPLFSPQGLFLLAPARAAADAAELQALNATEQVLLGTARTYLTLQGLAGLLDAAREAEAVALRREKDAGAQLEVGTAVEVALLRAQAETAQARAQIAELEGNREALLAVLHALTGERIVPGAPGDADNLPNPAQAADGAEPWRTTYAVRAAQEQVRSVEGLVRHDSFAWLPSVAAVARGNYNSNAGFTGENRTWDVAVAVNVPLFDRGVRYASLRENRARLSAARAALDSAERTARSNWIAARARLKAAEASLAQAKAQAQLAERAQKQVEAAYREGVGTSLELSDVDARRFLAASAAAQARAQVDVRRAELAAAEGRLALTLSGANDG